MAYINDLSATTELEAVNAMLSSCGEAPIAALDDTALESTDVQMAVNILRNTTRETLKKAWRFNTEWGVEFVPDAWFDWPDSSRAVTQIGIFKAPANLASFEVTNVAWQQGVNFMDAVIRPSKVYREDGNPVLVFYDRVWNRDGFDRGSIYINPVWFFGFEECPESARQFIVLRAARRLQQQLVGSQTLAGFTQQDEAMAFRQLQDDQGQTDDLNIFSNASVRQHLGGRTMGPSGVADYRGTPGYKPLP